MIKNLYLFFRPILPSHFGKDVFLTPKYLGKALGCESNIVHPQTLRNKEFPNQIEGVNMQPIIKGNIKDLQSRRRSDFLLFIEIIKRAKEIDLIMFIHFRRCAKIGSLLYKTLNKRGIVYVKLDVNDKVLERKKAQRAKGFIAKIKMASYRFFLRNIDIASCETQSAYDLLLQTKFSSPADRKKLLLMENGFDEELLESFNIAERSFKEKENIFITVGRLGTEQKNTSMLLNALKNVDLKEWKVYLIGEVEQRLEPEVKQLFRQCPELRDKVIFTGEIRDKKELWEYYNRAKVFTLTSIHESSGLVYYEAKRFSNYIISTDVGAFKDIAEDGKYGVAVAQNESSELAKKMQSIIDQTTKIDVYDNSFDKQSLSWRSRISIVADRVRKIEQLRSAKK